MICAIRASIASTLCFTHDLFTGADITGVSVGVRYIASAKNDPYGKRLWFLNFFLCLSRDCLGKTDHFYTNTAQKGRFLHLCLEQLGDGLARDVVSVFPQV